VVVEQFMTDTAAHADFVLPATTFLEHTDLYLAYGHYYLQLARPAVAAAGECRSNVEIFRALARKMRFDDSCFDDSEDDMIRTLLESSSRYLSGITLERLEKEHSIRLNISPPDQPFLPFADGGFRTGSGKFEFNAHEYDPPVESRYGKSELNTDYPLEFLSPKNDDSMNSTFGHRDSVDRQTDFLSIHPQDAEARGIANGTTVRVFNDRGSSFLTAKVCDDVQRGVVVSRSTRWNRRAPCGFGVNNLTSDRLSDLGGGAVFYSCLVDVAPATVTAKPGQ